MAWSQRLTEIDGRSASVLIDDRFASSCPVPELPRLVWFGLYSKMECAGGFWHPDETAELDAVEDHLIQLAAKFGNGWAVYVLRIDTYRLREYFLYCGDSAGMGQVLPILRAAHPGYRIECDERRDPEWRRYRDFLP